MNLHPKSSHNYDQAIKKTAKMNQGAPHYINGVRYSIKDIAKIIKMSVGRTGTLLKTYSAEKLIALKTGVK